MWKMGIGLILFEAQIVMDILSLSVYDEMSETICIPT